MSSDYISLRIPVYTIAHSLALGHFFLTFGLQVHMYTCMLAFARLMASHHTVKVHDIIAKHCTQIDQCHGPE